MVNWWREEKNSVRTENLPFCLKIGMVASMIAVLEDESGKKQPSGVFLEFIDKFFLIGQIIK